MKALTIIGTLFVLANNANAQICNPNLQNSASDQRFELVVGSDGNEVLDKETKLIWQRCSLGQIWNNSTCVGETSTKTWAEALAEAKSLGNGYRLPNIKELESLVKEVCSSPSIDLIFFPNTPNSPSYWSSSPFIHVNPVTYPYAWGVHFDTGVSNSYYSKSFKLNVRAVRIDQ